MKTIWQIGLVTSLSLIVVGCGKQESPESAPAVDAAQVTPSAATRIGANLRAQTVDQLRAALTKANAETRLYAPAGDNAFEILLALRDKLPGDVGVSSQLIDATPMLIAAIEQANSANDQADFDRMMGLLRQADPNNPALLRLEAARKTTLLRIERERTAAEAERQRNAAQQKAAAEAARIRVESQTKAATTPTAPPPPANDRAPAAPRAPRNPTPVPEPEEDPGPAPTADLHPVSTPEPKYPRTALTSGTSGEVTVELTVGRDGSVIAARVVASRPRGVFDNAALEAVKKWRYSAITSPMTIRKTFAFTPGE